MAVDATRRNGRRATPTIAAPAIPAATSPAAVTQITTMIRVLTVESTASVGKPRTKPPSWSHTAR